MGLIKKFWRKLTHTRALDQSSGELETAFFESTYRVTYILGLSGSDPQFSYQLYSNTVKTMTFLLVCAELWYGFTEVTNLDAVADTINATAIQFITIYRYKNMRLIAVTAKELVTKFERWEGMSRINFVVCTQNLKVCFKMNNWDFYKKLASSMESPYFDITTEKRKKLVEYWVQANERYVKLLLTLGNCCLTFWFIFPLVDDVEYNFVVGVRLPIYYENPQMYPIAYVLVVIFFTYISYYVMAMDLRMQTHLLHLLCQLNVLCDCYENLLTECKTGFEDIKETVLVHNKSFADKYTKRLGELVVQHKLILSYVMILRKTLSAPMLAQLAASGTLICFVGYQATTAIAVSLAKFLMSFLFLGYNVFELYIICRWCEEITNWLQKTGDAIYCSGWECGISQLRGVRSTIMFIIARANNPLYFTAGGMYNLTLTSYTTLVKTSYSALTVLLRFRHD